MINGIGAGPVYLNSVFSNAKNGTGVWTRCLISSFPEWGRVAPRALDPSSGGVGNFYKKLLFERTFKFGKSGYRVHPYLAAACDKKAFIVVLDRIGENDWSPVHRRSIMKSAKVAYGVATISNAQASDLSVWLERSVHVLSPFPDQEFFDTPLRFSPSDQRSRQRVIYWGGYHPRKRIFESLDALEGLEIDVIIVGDPIHRVPSNVRFTGTLTTADLIAEIDRSDVVFYPSSMEGFGLPVYEALLRGKRLVCQALPSYQDIVKPNNLSMFTFPDGDWRQFRSGIEAACSRAWGIPNASYIRTVLRTTRYQEAKEQLRTQVARWAASCQAD